MTMPAGHKPKQGARKVGDVIACRCGCDMTFVLDKANANRRFAPGCVNRPHWARSDVIQARKRVSNKKRLAWLAEQKGPARKVCKTCFDLPHRRPATGCPSCLLPHGDAPASMPARGCSPIVGNLTNSAIRCR